MICTRVNEQEDKKVKKYNAPEMMLVSLGEDELIRTSGLSLENEGDISNMGGLDFSQW